MTAWIAAHVALACLLGLLAAKARGRGFRIEWAATEFWVALLIPGLGALAVAIQLFLEATFRRVVAPVDTRGLAVVRGHVAIAPRQGNPVSELRVGCDALPFAETLNGKETKVVDLAMRRLARAESSTSLDRLREAVDVTDLRTRVRARGVMVHIEDRLIQRIRTSGDPALRGRAFVKLAHLSTDSGAARTHLQSAAIEFRQAVDDGVTGRVWLELGRVQLALGDAPGALDSFSKYILSAPGESDGYLARAEANFRLGELSAVRDDVARAATMSMRKAS